jgi:hypothetical protein
MKISVHSLYWNNIDEKIINSHINVTKHFDINVNYTSANIKHGFWMENIILNQNSDIFCFFDVDCVPMNRDIYDKAIQYVAEYDSFIGPAQVSNHIYPKSHIFASPAFFFITKSCYEKLNCPTFVETNRSDVGEEVSYTAEENNKQYRCWYPTMFDSTPVEGIWKLSSYGFYGIGTIFGDSIYHLYQSRFNKNVDLFEKRCSQIINNNFDKSNMMNSLNNYKYEYLSK